jgi:hypothetical protein
LCSIIIFVMAAMAEKRESWWVMGEMSDEEVMPIFN